MYGEVFVSTISLVFLLLMAFLKLVAKIIYQVCLVSGLPSRLRMYAVHTSPAYTAVITIWQVQNGDPTRAYRSSKTPDKCRVCVLRDSDPIIHTAQRLPIANWSRAYCAITIMASNTKLTMDHDREIAELRSPLR